MMTTTPLLAAPGVLHGFFGRSGGRSVGPFGALNVGLRSGDERATVLLNRDIAAMALGSGVERLVTARQVHGTTCIEVDEPWRPEDAPEADALVTRRPGVLLGALSADCAPILLTDPSAKVVACAHAGWKGALTGVVASVVAAMERLGAERGRIKAAIGPCIAKRSYEVGAEFRAQFVGEDPAHERFFTTRAQTGKPHFDLEGFVLARLAEAGVRSVTAFGLDTVTAPERYFSYRRTTLAGEKQYGLQLSAIRLLAG